MPKIDSRESNIVRIEPNPFKKSSMKIKQQVISVSGGVPKFKVDEKGNKVYQTALKDPRNLTRMPGTLVEYTAALGKNGLITGLDEYITNPFSDLDFYRDGWENILKGKNKIRLQEMLEYKHDKPKGYYTSQVSDIRSSYDMEDAPFYQRQESRVSLRDGVTYFDLNNPIQEVNYYMLKAHKMIANSYDELKFSPYATHYIVDVKEKLRKSTEESRNMNKFAARLEELMGLSDNTIIHMSKAMDLSSNKTLDNKEDAYDDIDMLVRKSTEKFEDFMDLYDMWKNPNTRALFLGYSELYDFLRVPGLISMRDNKVYWSQPAKEGGKIEQWQWKSKQDFVTNFLTAAKYQEEVDILRAEYRSKTRFEMI